MLVAFPHPPGGGGPGSFQRRFESSLKERGHSITYTITDKNADVVFIVGGTRKIFKLLLAKYRKIPILHRLDGIGWLHRKQIRISKLKSFFYGEFINLLINLEHSFIANGVIYQSEFVKEWWRAKGWLTRRDSLVVNNGVCLKRFKPDLTSNRPIRLICIEGTIDYSPFAIDLINQLNQRLKNEIPFSLYGSFSSDKAKHLLDPSVDYRGRLSPDEIVGAYQRSIYFSLDVNAACPNTVVEALACGTPVVGFDTGALKELVSSSAGEIVSYGGNPWKLDFPDLEGLIKAIIKVKENWVRYSVAARKTAEERFGLNQMIEQYLALLDNIVVRKNGNAGIH